MNTKRDKPNMISNHQSLKQTAWKRRLAIEVQWPGIIYQVKLKIQKVLILLKQICFKSINSFWIFNFTW